MRETGERLDLVKHSYKSQPLKISTKRVGCDAFFLAVPGVFLSTVITFRTCCCFCCPGIFLCVVMYEPAVFVSSSLKNITFRSDVECVVCHITRTHANLSWAYGCI